MANEVIISKWKEKIYIEEFDIFKNSDFLKILDHLCFIVFPEIHLYNCGFRFRNKIKLLNTKTGQTRILTEDLRGEKYE